MYSQFFFFFVGSTHTSFSIEVSGKEDKKHNTHSGAPLSEKEVTAAKAEFSTSNTAYVAAWALFDEKGPGAKWFAKHSHLHFAHALIDRVTHKPRLEIGVDAGHAATTTVTSLAVPPAVTRAFSGGVHVVPSRGRQKRMVRTAPGFKCEAHGDKEIRDGTIGACITYDGHPAILTAFHGTSQGVPFRVRDLDQFPTMALGGVIVEDHHGPFDFAIGALIPTVACTSIYHVSDLSSRPMSGSITSITSSELFLSTATKPGLSVHIDGIHTVTESRSIGFAQVRDDQDRVFGGMVVTGIVQEGDSGAAVVHRGTGALVGIVASSSHEDGTTIVTPMFNIMKQAKKAIVVV